MGSAIHHHSLSLAIFEMRNRYFIGDPYTSCRTADCWRPVQRNTWGYYCTERNTAILFSQPLTKPLGGENAALSAIVEGLPARYS